MKDIKVSLRNQTLFINLEEYPVINEIIISGEKRKNIKKLFSKDISQKNGTIYQIINIQDEKLIKRLYSTLGFNF